MTGNIREHILAAEFVGLQETRQLPIVLDWGRLTIKPLMRHISVKFHRYVGTVSEMLSSKYAVTDAMA
jgi:hypothetical protein